MAEIDVTQIIEYDPTFRFQEERLPWGFISCLPADTKTIVQLFGNLPIGTGEKIPFFQNITGNEIDSFLLNLPIQGFFQLPLTNIVVSTIIQTISRNWALIAQNQNLTDEIIRYRNQKHRLVEIGTALTRESDLNKLLRLILTICREMVDADAGSIYVRNRVKPGGSYTPSLTFKVAQNDSVNVGEMNEFTLPIDENSIAGYVAKTALSLNIDDVNNIEESVPWNFNREWDKKNGYTTKSMLTLPLINISGEVVGVLQLINKKNESTMRVGDCDRFITEANAFTLSDEEFVQSIASQAAVSIERAHYHECIKALFEGFLESSIAAIDERDTVTSGHSKRVVGYASAFIEAVKHDEKKRFQILVESSEKIVQFQYATLLHDIGKIGVPEVLLTKETRLSQCEWKDLEMRFRFMIQESDKGKSNGEDSETNDLEFISLVNKAGYLDDQNYEKLLKVKNRMYRFTDGTSGSILTDTEWKKLSIRRGNLTDEERGAINSHAASTYRILSKIPWTKELEMVPHIAAQHHERLDGTGYPNGLKSEAICIESRVLAVVDIYESLVAADRPYKPKVPVEKALDILRSDAEAGKLDKTVVDFFIEKKIYEVNVG
ncbi:MAG TPA: HD domain-containing phosphohydrolase [Chitinispirillaceae bacterium]|nr:HD domain-containing phosphohydrolase [Chitinispirillaceae bacterium]